MRTTPPLPPWLTSPLPSSRRALLTTRCGLLLPVSVFPPRELYCCRRRGGAVSCSFDVRRSRYFFFHPAKPILGRRRPLFELCFSSFNIPSLVSRPLCRHDGEIGGAIVAGAEEEMGLPGEFDPYADAEGEAPGVNVNANTREVRVFFFVPVFSPLVPPFRRSTSPSLLLQRERVPPRIRPRRTTGNLVHTRTHTPQQNGEVACLPSPPNTPTTLSSRAYLAISPSPLPCRRGESHPPPPPRSPLRVAASA